jgi:c-di-GMP-related signal transduction protein
MQYMARQPILDADEQTAGYEFLYRAAAESVANFPDVDTASRTVLEQILLLGCRELSGGNRLFINCSGEVLAREYINVFPPQAIVVEILESVEPTPAVIAACEQLKRSGFMIALDDFVPGPNTLPLLPFADIIKVDFRTTDERTRGQIVERYCQKVLPLAEKVETRTEYKSAVNGGFKLFQGYYFCEPVLLVNRELSPSKLNYLRMMEQTSREEIDLRKMEEVIKSDPALCFLLGLFSMMDTILGIPLEQLLNKVKVPPETEAALLGKSNRLRDILDLIIAYDRANWDKTRTLCAKVHIDQADLADDYIRALQWVDQILGMTMEQPQAVPDMPPQTQAAVGNGLRPV